MERLYIEEILQAVGGELICETDAVAVNSVCINSKKVTQGSLFVPIKGEKFDGHEFIGDAFAAGATAALTERYLSANFDKALIKVNDTKIALQRLAAYYRRKFTMPVVGVTGSVGKTSTKEMISAVLAANFNVAKTSGNLNGQIGVPLSIFEIESCHDVAVIEMGISEFDEMDTLSKIAAPTCAVILNIGVTHIENLHTKENILNEKFKITESLTPGSYLFINGDDDLLCKLQTNEKFRIISFGIRNDCAINAKNIRVKGEMTEFDVVSGNKCDHFVIPVLGDHNIYNAMAAIAVGMSMDMSVKDIQKGLLLFKNLSMRQCVRHVGRFTVIDDSYNANPDSMKSVLKVLAQIASKGRKIAVLADMLELGDMAPQLHREIGHFAARIGVNVLITVGEMAKFIAQGAAESDEGAVVTYSFSSKDEACKCLQSILRPGDCVLVKGSRGMHTEKIVENIIAEEE